MKLIQASQFSDDIKGRFWSRVAVKDGSDCWVWLGHTNKKGYGSFSPGRKIYHIAGTKISHRFAFLFGNGSLVKELLVCHSCDTPGCCNPSHLWQGTAKENSADMVKKDRSCRGERQGHTLLTDTDVIAIRACISTGRFEQKELAIKFSVAQQTISRIATYKDWRHI